MLADGVPIPYYLYRRGSEDIWGPFESEDKAWHHLFGRESTEEEREAHREAGWIVSPNSSPWIDAV